MRYPYAVATFLLLFASLSTASAQDTRLLRNPAISADHIAFVYAADIWVTGRNGGEARRLTTFEGAETEPHFSPDGQWVAFSGQYDGNTDVYVVSVNGGEPERLTWHPSGDVVFGWTKDGRYVVFSSSRVAMPVPAIPKFWKVDLNGNFPEALPIPRAYRGDFSPDGKRMAYQKIRPWESEFRNYRGGQNDAIRIIDLETLDEETLPWDGANDNSPVWIGNSIFFLSDRDYAMNIWEYDLSSQEVFQRTFFFEFDSKNLEAGDGTLIFENGGYLYTIEAADGEARKVSITVRGDFSWARPHWETVSSSIVSQSLSPSGKRALFEARGEIFTVPAEKGEIRNLSKDSGSADRAPAWSPDGKYISWFSDASGEYKLIITDQFGQNRQTIGLQNPTMYYTPSWSPDSKLISFADADRNLWVIEVESGDATKIDDEGFAHPDRTIYPEWSPDSKWIAYTKRLTNEYNAIFVYSVEEEMSYQLTDGMSDNISPAWDAGGKYLYFLGSTDFGLNVGWLDMTSYNIPLNRSIYLAVLSKDEPSPFPPESDDEEISEDESESGGDEEDEDNEEDEEEDEEEIVVTIDFEGMDQRIIALGVPARNYVRLEAGAEGSLFYTESVQNEPGLLLNRYKISDREAKPFLTGVLGFEISSDGNKLLYSSPGNKWGIVDADGSPNLGDEQLNLADMRMEVDPPAEWRQIFREAWRYQRDFFYVDNVHGADMDWLYKTYGAWLDYVRHRSDLTYVLDILGGEISVGHSFTGGGDLPTIASVPVGLLGSDFSIENGRYRIAKIYSGENWNPNLRSPLSGPGIDASNGDYIISVNGVDLTSETNIFSLFARTTGKQTVLKLNDRPSQEKAREIVVIPVSFRGEANLRQRDWIEGNRRKVDEMSNGQLAYVWLPDTGMGGYTNFNRYFFAQKNKKGAVIDERWNRGGSIADYIVDLMSRELIGYFNNPIGDKQPWTAPNAALWGPKVMIINDAAGSGGDILPYMFRFKKIGPLIGTRTWGGLVGTWDVPPLIDGGRITAPRGGFFDINGEWSVENEGVAPDIEVFQDPKRVNAGRDPQLEAAVAEALRLLETERVTLLPQPPDPIRVRRPNR
ncbi:MAG: S41 family peptidase [Rhodothermia bacterium]|nr:MAG: S41 family peptidase [Rhodothermia bacterium]